MPLNKKNYCFIVLVYGLSPAIALHKSVRNRLEGIAVTTIYYGLSWFSTVLRVALLVIGLWNATLTLGKKGFCAVSFLVSLFAAIAVQKNTRDAHRAGTAQLSAPGLSNTSFLNSCPFFARPSKPRAMPLVLWWP